MGHTLRCSWVLGALVVGLLPMEVAGVAGASPQQDALVAADTIMLRFWDGRILWGRIADHDAEQLHFERLDNGGLVRVPWSRLDPTLADELLERFGYVDLSGDEIMVEADRLVLVDGTELIGKILSRTDADILVKTSRSLVQVPKARLAGAATVVQVPALDVFTREELYQQELARVAPGTARAHVELAQFCERVFAFDRALEHLRAARDLDPNLDSIDLEGALARNAEKLANLEQLEHLREVDRLRARGRFADALAHAELFASTYPKSPLLRDAQRKLAQVAQARERHLREEVVSAWHSLARKRTFRAAQDPDLTVEAAVGWLDDGLHDELLALVRADLARGGAQTVTTDEIASYWAEREGGRWQKASYGEGSWLLGEEAARKGLPEPKAEEGGTESETEALRRRLAERMERYQRSQSVVRRTNSEHDSEEERSSFWKGWSSAGRAQWMLAYYAEHSGDMELRPKLLSRNCRDCNGTGAREIINTGGSVSGSRGAHLRTVPCRTCHGIGLTRIISYR